MIIKTVVKETRIIDNTNFNIVTDRYINEPISGNICNAINDFYNLMHLIRNSWVNKKYILKMYEAGYNIYDKNDELQGWIGVKEKDDCLLFLLFYRGELYDNAIRKFKGQMEVYDFDEDIWVYSSLNIIDILQKKKVGNQKKIIKKWINENIGRILCGRKNGT
jgi:hypothetical protein